MVMFFDRLIFALLCCFSIPDIGSKLLNQIVAVLINQNSTRKQQCSHKPDAIQHVIFRFFNLKTILLKLGLERCSSRIQNYSSDFCISQPIFQICGKLSVRLLPPLISARVVILPPAVPFLISSLLPQKKCSRILGTVVTTYILISAQKSCPVCALYAAARASVSTVCLSGANIS